MIQVVAITLGIIAGSVFCIALCQMHMAFL